MNESPKAGTFVKRAEAEINDAVRLRKRKPLLFAGLVLAVLFLAASWAYEKFWGIPELKDRIASLRLDLESKKGDLILLQSQLAPFRAFALEKYGGEVGQSLARLAEDMRKFDAELKMVERKIRTISVTVTFDFSAKWQGGKLPQPEQWLMMGGTKGADGIFVLSDGELDRTEFHHPDRIAFTRLDGDNTRLTYSATGAAGSQIFGELPERIRAIKQLGFSIIGIKKPNIEGDKFTPISLRAEFFVNGVRSFVGEAKLRGTWDVTDKDQYLQLDSPLELTPVK